LASSVSFLREASELSSFFSSSLKTVITKEEEHREQEQPAVIVEDEPVPPKIAFKSVFEPFRSTKSTKKKDRGPARSPRNVASKKVAAPSPRARAQQAAAAEREGGGVGLDRSDEEVARVLKELSEASLGRLFFVVIGRASGGRWWLMLVVRSQVVVQKYAQTRDNQRRSFNLSQKVISFTVRKLAKDLFTTTT
jgi:hypothetical protein